MRYSTGMMDRRVMIARRVANQTETFGKSGSPQYEWLNPNRDHGFWAAEDYNRGTKSLREGMLDAYDVVMFRMDYHEGIDRWCLIQYHGKWYQILSCNEDYRTNKIQITAQEMANQDVNLVYSPSASQISGGSSESQEVGE